MIKWLCFAEVPAAQLLGAGVRPARLAVSRALDGPEVVVAAWFDDRVAAETFAAGQPGVPHVLAEEHVLRGADWLERRWAGGGARLKHVALARRADGLDLPTFLDRWRTHAGTAGGTPIPDEARGLAYAQNHPLAEGAYDAVNEVWFDDLDSLRRRVDWFAANGVGAPDDLFGASTFLALREEVLR